MASNISLRQFLRALLKLVRVQNLLIIVFTQYLARIFLVGPKNEWLSHILDIHQFFITLSTVLIAAAGYIINDYFDIKIDLVNKPQEVIIGRYIRRRWAMIIHQILNGLGILIGLFLGLKVLIVNVLAVACLWFYSSAFKKKAFFGNFMIAMLTASSLIVMAVYYDKNDNLLNIYALFAFTITLVREIIKDIEDMRGDARFGCKTLPIIWGIRKTKRLLFVILIVFMILTLSIGYSIHNQAINYIFVLMNLLVGWLFYKISIADRKIHFTKLSLYCKILMILGTSSMIFI